MDCLLSQDAEVGWRRLRWRSVATGGFGRPRPGRAVRRLARRSAGGRGSAEARRDGCVRSFDGGTRTPCAAPGGGRRKRLAGQSALCSPFCSPLVSGRAPLLHVRSALPRSRYPVPSSPDALSGGAAGVPGRGCGHQREGGQRGGTPRSFGTVKHSARRAGAGLPLTRGAGRSPSVRRRVPNLPSSSGGSRGGFDVSHPASGLTSGGPERPTVPPSNVTNP